MKRTLAVIATVCTAFVSTEASSKTLSPEESEEILSAGEVIWTNDRGAILVRRRGSVFLCMVSREYNTLTSQHYLEITCEDSDQ